MHITYKQTTPRENNLRKFKQKREERLWYQRDVTLEGRLISRKNVRRKAVEPEM